MQISAVDEYKDLFSVTDIVSPDLLQKILSTPWWELEYRDQPAQENWPRRLILTHQLTWLDQWIDELSAAWPKMELCMETKLQPYTDTAWWVDEPGFTCAIHTDGEMPGSLHLDWIGDKNLATMFYHSKHDKDIRFQQDFVANSGYAMINQLDDQGYRHLQWHGMLHPVPENSFRLTSYTWLIPVK